MKFAGRAHSAQHTFLVGPMIHSDEWRESLILAKAGDCRVGGNAGSVPKLGQKMAETKQVPAASAAACESPARQRREGNRNKSSPLHWTARAIGLRLRPSDVWH